MSEIQYRKPKFEDIDTIYTLINDYAAEGIMLPKSRITLYETIYNMIVAKDASTEKVVGVGALHVTWDELAEIRSLAVDKEYTHQHIGSEIVNRLIEEGKSFGVRKFFTLTYQPEFFGSVGFSVVDKSTLPHKIWRDCIDCPKFRNCDEIAMILEVSP